MEDFEYNELFEIVFETYNEFLEKDRGHRYAMARTREEYRNLGKVEDYIVDTATGEILITYDKAFVGHVKAITKNLKSFNLIDVTEELTQDEITDLFNRIKIVLEALEKVEIDYNPHAE